MLKLKIHKIKFLALCLLPFQSVQAHPHILIDANVTFHLEKKSKDVIFLTGYSYIWTFDENFSLLLLGDYDDNQDNELNLDELKLLGRETMEGAKELGYFTKLISSAKEVTPLDATQIIVSLDKNRLTFKFKLELPRPIEIGKKLSFSLFDEEYYTAFIIDKKLGYQFTSEARINCNIITFTTAQDDDNIETALKNAFNQDNTNKGFGAKFADNIGFNCQ